MGKIFLTRHYSNEDRKTIEKNYQNEGSINILDNQAYFKWSN